MIVVILILLQFGKIFDDDYELGQDQPFYDEKNGEPTQKVATYTNLF